MVYNIIIPLLFCKEDDDEGESEPIWLLLFAFWRPMFVGGWNDVPSLLKLFATIIPPFRTFPSFELPKFCFGFLFWMVAKI